MQSDDRWVGTVYVESIYAPGSLGCRDIAAIDETNNLADPCQVLSSACSSLSDNNGGWIMALVDVLVQILDRSGRGAALDIDVGALLCSQIKVMRNNPTIVNLEVSSAIDLPILEGIHQVRL